MLYSNHELYNLNCLIPPNSGWFLEEPNDINDVSQIVGHGIHDGLSHALLLSPGTSPTPTPGPYRVYLPVALRK
jgi:hypothetical protein